jgi:hypothetical protein
LKTPDHVSREALPFCTCLVLCLFSLWMLPGCGTNTSSPSQNPPPRTGDGTISLTAVVRHLGALGSTPAVYPSRSSGERSKPKAGGSESAAVNLTPCAYHIALVNFWFLREDSTEVSVLNPIEGTPQYTESNPLIVDFSSGNFTQELLSDASLPEGTYIGYKMQFLYLEMRLPAALHFPSVARETDLPGTLVSGDLDNVQGNYSFRLYFNATGACWKRDFVVELVEGADQWFWLRRDLEDRDGIRNFIIAVAGNSHPPGGAGSNSTIDLFDDPDFWGAQDLYSSSDNPIIISTLSTAGGVNATMDRSFTISGDSLDVTLAVDVQNTLNYSEDGVAPAGAVFSPDVLDLGPGYAGDSYGDRGLHPFVPRFSILVTPR